MTVKAIVQRSRIRGTRAFSLVELLFVSAILGVLAALLLPALAAAGRQARRMACLNQLRQIGLGLANYVENHPPGFFPRQTAPPIAPPIGMNPWPSPSWIFALSEAVSSIDQIRLCPSDPERGRRQMRLGSSYVLNDYLAEPSSAEALSRAENEEPDSTPKSALTGPGGETWTRYDGPRRWDQLESPAATLLVMEGSDRGAQIGDERTRPDTWLLGWEFVEADLATRRHGPSANYLYADWHVETIRANALEARIKQGDHFGIPPSR